ncbi:MAG: hypothetical protein ABJF10_06460 [Chthoniobacter sp.]
MKDRPWIWLILANVLFIAGTITLVVIAVRHQQPEVPLVHER